MCSGAEQTVQQFNTHITTSNKTMEEYLQMAEFIPVCVFLSTGHDNVCPCPCVFKVEMFPVFAQINALI